MPRRPRPQDRKPPKNVATSSTKVAAPLIASRAKPASHHHLDSEAEAEYSSQAGTDVSGDDSDAGPSRSDRGHEDSDVDAEPDAPRVAQWVDEEVLEGGASDPEEDADDSHLEADLQPLSYGALRKAQRALASDSEAEDGFDESEPQEQPSSLVSQPQQQKGSVRQRKEIAKRTHKHAPMEMSSKRPVSRSRLVVEQKLVPRDPRFLPITGEFDAKRFQSQYGFISSMHKDELGTLRDNLKRARKLLASSPRDLREERQEEVDRLERAVKRAESAVHKDRREKVETEALGNAAKEEREKRKQGKKAWYMKDADKKALLLRAKYDALATSGGKGAVRKAIEKKQKKVSQKEKKKRPFAVRPPAGSRPTRDGDMSRKRPRFGDGDGSRKRQRTS